MDAEFNDPKYTFKHSLTALEDESLPFEQYRVRMYRDLTTDAYTKTFLDNADTRYLFLDYTFHMINFKLKVGIDVYLRAKNQKPLCGTEDIFFIFKGGNVMNFAYNNFIAPFEVLFPALADFFTNSKRKFAISDVDYSVYIKCSSGDRFSLIHSGIIFLLSSVLTEIKTVFNTFYLNRAAFAPVADPNPDTDDRPDDVNEHEPLATELKNLIANREFAPVLAGLPADNPMSAQVRELLGRCNLFLAQIRALTNNINNFIKIYKLITIIQCMNLIKFVAEQNAAFVAVVAECDAVQLLMRPLITAILDKKKNNIFNENFYSQAKLDLFFDRLAAMFDVANADLTHPTYEYRNMDFVEQLHTYQFVPVLHAGPARGNFSVVSKASSIIKSNDDPVRQRTISSFVSADNYHYMTFNNVIRRPIKNAGIVADFDLMRIKFNVVLSGGHILKNGVATNLSIPSEFIDVSIPGFDDTTNSEYIHHAHMHGDKAAKMFFVSRGRFISVCAYSLYELYADILVVLFAQNLLFPWIDKKFDKRITRSLFLGMMHCFNLDRLAGPITNLPIFVELLDLCREIHTYATVDGTPFPIATVAKFIKCKDEGVGAADVTYAEKVLDEMACKSDHVADGKNLMFVSPKYELIRQYVLCVIVWGWFSRQPLATTRAFINKSRSNYMRVTVENDAVVADTMRNFLILLNTIINDGNTIHMMFDTILRAPHALPDTGITMSGGKKALYLKYKKKYFKLKELKKEVF